MPESVKALTTQHLVERTDVRDVRAVQLSAEVHVPELPGEIDAVVDVRNPQYVFNDGRLFVRVAHDVDFRSAHSTVETALPVGAKLGEIHVVHVAELVVDGNAPEPSEVDDLFRGNTVFMVHPYARAAIQRLAMEVGLPPVVLPYLRRSSIAAQAKQSLLPASVDPEPGAE